MKKCFMRLSRAWTRIGWLVSEAKTVHGLRQQRNKRTAHCGLHLASEKQPPLFIFCITSACYLFLNLLQLFLQP